MESQRKTNQKRTFKKISKNGISGKEDHREKANVVVACQKKGRRARVLSRMIYAPIPGKRRRGRQKIWWWKDL